jgi:hypothetical protein
MAGGVKVHGLNSYRGNPGSNPDLQIRFVVDEVGVNQGFYSSSPCFPLLIISPSLLHTRLSRPMRCTIALTTHHVIIR